MASTTAMTDEVSSSLGQTMTIQQALDVGVEYHKAGRLREAESIYTDILQHTPNQPIAMHLLGLVAHQSGNNAVAIELITDAIKIKQDYGEAYSNLGLIMKDSGDPISRRLGFLLSYFQELGGINSSDHELRNGKHERIPLLTSSFLHWFETVDWSLFSLLELGSGSSTFYFAKHFDSVTSYENNKAWHQNLKPTLPANVAYYFSSPIRRALVEENLENFDVVLIDAGENRAKLARAIGDSGFTGLIFFDNAEWYRKGISILTETGYIEVPFFGIKPTQNWLSCTSVLVHSSNLSQWFPRQWKRLPSLTLKQNSNPWDDEYEQEST